MSENENPNELIEYFIINKNLKMSANKIGSQCAHAAHNYEDEIKYLWCVLPRNERVKNFYAWRNNPNRKIVVLEAHTSKLVELAELKFTHVRDTEVPDGSITCACLGIMTKKEKEKYL